MSTSAVARAGITLRLLEPHSMVGAIVEPISARIVSPSPSYSRSASASAASRSDSSRPSSARSIAIASGARRRLGQSVAEAGQQRREQGYGVPAQRRHGRVAGLADRGDLHREGALLADGVADHLAAVGERQPLAAALVHAVGGSDVGALLEQPAHPDVREPVLLVGHGDEPQVAARPEAAARQLGHRHRPGRDLVLHVDGAAAPQPAVVVDHRLERRVRPVARVARHHVGVPDERQRLGGPSVEPVETPGIRATTFARWASRATTSASTPLRSR